MADVDDIGVLGSGPAALAIAAACARSGASVTVLAPQPAAAWGSNYCAWRDELPPMLDRYIEQTWPNALVATQHGEHGLDRSYVKLDGDALRQAFRQDLLAGQSRFVADLATSITHGPEISTIHTAGGITERVRVVIDASGARSPFVKRPKRRDPAFQIAYGLLLHAPDHPFELDRAVLMDFRAATAGQDGPPTFLYALPLAKDRLFLEETSLANRPGVPMGLLRSRLETRLDRLGLSRAPHLDEEQCRITMGLPLPAREQAVVPFGAAASMVHPATGYSVAHALRKAEPVARAVVRALRADGHSAAIAAGNRAVWPAADRAAWELYGLGLESLLNMDARETSAFFDGFFDLPQADWSGFLGGLLGPRQVVGIMTRVLRNVPSSVRWGLLRTGLSFGAAPLAQTFLQPETP
jgi:lycopene cyclase-like protein